VFVFGEPPKVFAVESPGEMFTGLTTSVTLCSRPACRSLSPVAISEELDMMTGSFPAVGFPVCETMLEYVAILLWLTSLRQGGMSQTACFRRGQVDHQTGSSGSTTQVYFIRQKVSALASFSVGSSDVI
jgi:hypothetical protein